jgi:hypothetical protein
MLQSMRDANPTPAPCHCHLGGHFGNDCRLLAVSPRVEAAQVIEHVQADRDLADREMPHNWWIFRRIFSFDGGFLPGKGWSPGMPLRLSYLFSVASFGSSAETVISR